MFRRYRLLVFILPLLATALACRAVTSRLNLAPSPTTVESTAALFAPTGTLEAATATLLPPGETASATAVPSATTAPSATPSPSFTPEPTQTSTGTVSVPRAAVTPAPFQLRVFEKLWETVNQEYMYADFNGVDWEAVRAEFRALVESGLTDGEFYLAMAEMVFRLGDDHSTYLSPGQVAESEAELAGDNNYVGIGVVSVLIPDQNVASVIAVFPGSPAEAAGIKLHDSLLAVDGQPVVDASGDHREIMRGPEGSTIQVTVQSPGEEPRQVTITRMRVQGSMPVPYQVLQTPDGKRVGYILLITFYDETIDEQVADALEAMNRDSPLDGVVIDNRYNGGGISNVVLDTLRYFVDGLTGHFVSREGERPFSVEGLDIAGSHRVPLVVLVGSGTASFGEIFSGILKDFDRAYLIGEVTDGNVEILYGYDFEDGSRAWIAHDYFQPLNHPEENWELTGIIPDRIAPGEWSDFTLEKDPAVLAALDYFDENQ